MPDVKQVTTILSNPSRTNPTGQVTIGYYTLEGSLLTMTDGNGAPFRSLSGERMTHKLEAGEDAGVVAQRLTRKIYSMVQGDGMAGFNRPLDYPSWGIA
jgi:hypothetical protein